MEKKSFLIYLDYEEQFNILTDEQLGCLIRSIMKYEKTQEEPVFEDNILKLAFSFIKQQLDRDKEKWQEEKKKRSSAGKKGMAKRWKKEETEDNNVINDNNKNNNVKSVIKRNNKNN